MRQAHELRDSLERTTQREFPQDRKDMVKNHAGGVVFGTSRWTRLDRFLILGTSGGTYYVGEREHTRENMDLVTECIAVNGVKAVTRAAVISREGRAPKNDQAIFVLACAMAKGNEECRHNAYESMGLIVRIPTHLFMLLEFLKLMGKGVSSGLKKAISKWYLDKSSHGLANHVLKYRQRNGWTHKDVLRLAHPKTDDNIKNSIFRWVTHPDDTENIDRMRFRSDSASHMMCQFLDLQATKYEDHAAEIFSRPPKFTWEMIPNDFLNSVKVWEQLVENGMPITATIRNLPKLTRLGVVKPLSSGLKKICETLQSEEALSEGRVHPVQVLIALKTYALGRSIRGNSTWRPVDDICDALDNAFYKSFNGLEQSDKRVYIGLDVSGSMDFNRIASIPNLTARVAGSAICMALKRQYSTSVVRAFSDGMVPVEVRRNDSLVDLTSRVHNLPFSRTDCALPMLDARNERLDVDAFVIITDNETWSGDVHPYKALERYRKFSGLGSKLAVLGLTSTRFSIADPDDPGTMDMVGLDASIPQLLHDFIG